MLTETEALNIAVNWLPQIKIVAARACRYAPHIQSCEVESYLVSRMHGILVNYSPQLSALSTHVSRNLNWYAYKFVCAECRRNTLSQQTDKKLREYKYKQIFNLDARDEVSNILGGLSDYHQILLYMRYVMEMTQEQIADELGISKSSARNHCLDALNEAREIASVEL